MKSADLSIVRNAFIVDDNGNLINRTNRIRAKAGEIAGTPRPDGYRQVSIGRNVLLVHRVIFALANGYWPENEVDHANGDKSDNRPSNLREATKSQNGANKRLTREGMKGATWCKRARKWRSTLRKEGKMHHLGLFDTPEEAHEAYMRAARVYHGEFARAA